MTCASVTHDDRLTLSNRPSSATTAKAAPKIVSLEMVLVLRWKTCGIGEATPLDCQTDVLQLGRRNLAQQFGGLPRGRDIDEVGLRNDAQAASVAVDDWNASNLAFLHQHQDVFERGRSGNSLDRRAHARAGGH